MVRRASYSAKKPARLDSRFRAIRLQDPSQDISPVVFSLLRTGRTCVLVRCGDETDCTPPVSLIYRRCQRWRSGIRWTCQRRRHRWHSPPGRRRALARKDCCRRSRRSSTSTPTGGLCSRRRYVEFECGVDSAGTHHSCSLPPPPSTSAHRLHGVVVLMLNCRY